MTVVDTSALMAILLGEAAADACAAAIEADEDLLISAATVAEASIVARRRGLGEQMGCLLDGLGMEVAPVTPADAHAVASAYERWGKGIHPAGLNFGDCFAYALAKREGAPLLFVGDDFARTDIVPRLAG
ncbi:type II toxin-antitoxin system VapC family toxin [Novosphingobium cyanobacteriorum]|uniref:Ribonuclease VapC n=1 Tax=Novosphingobium cyanobacteriorum TaxID=3024215 RepID=A0ABT6CDM8_9SPHN|nr:type II toxin-antitoxin system VapC family toxin [Novosphingobium cyanobacteriorum]MDF8332032.1 type II toxin-antitoxin system VapC family toxin [Novosphingobium cyanobacteriorum]